MASLYPSRTEATLKFCTLLTRGPFLCALVSHAVHPLYLKLINRLQWSDAAVFALVTSLSHSIPYVVTHSFFALCDKFGWFKRHRLPRKQAQLPSKQLIVRTLIQAAVGQLTTPVIAYLMYKHVLRSPTSQNAPMPSLTKTWAHFAGATMVNEIGFYTVHRILHEFPWLYKNIHKQHHQYIGTISIAAEYAALPEEIFAATLPTIGYMMWARVPFPIFAVWLINRLIETYESHSGYCFRDTWPARWFGLLNAERAEFHDYHHTANVGNFGTNIFLDYLLGTMTPFLESKQRAATQKNTN